MNNKIIDDNHGLSIKKKESFAKFIKYLYLSLIGIIYLSIAIYLAVYLTEESSMYQSIILLIITGIIGTYSKNLYFNLIEYIFDNKESLTTKIKQDNQKVEIIINWITLILIIGFIQVFLPDNIYMKIAFFAVIGLIILPFIILAYKFLNNKEKSK